VEIKERTIRIEQLSQSLKKQLQQAKEVLLGGMMEAEDG
jgi:hypothetical protein